MIQELTGVECQNFLNAEICTVLDVRSKTEYDSFHIPEAMHVDIMTNSAIEELASLPKSENYIVYCAIGVRSSSAIRLMEQLGFEQLYHLTHGILNYEGEIVETEKNYAFK